MTPHWHCQICERPIKAKNGLIAHHGYKRPGQGWQTSSCFGARYRPYEVACDALPPAIASCAGFLARTTLALVQHINSPPATMSYTRGTWKQETLTVERPEGFTPDAQPDYRPDSYVTHFLRRRHELEQEIRFAQQDLTAMRKRLADWKPQAAMEVA